MTKIIDLTGQTFSNLKVVGRAKKPSPTSSGAFWLCHCICGNSRIASGATLRCGKATSCGCAKEPNRLAAITKHGMAGTPTYVAWMSMRTRCHNEKSKYYIDYGARGISVCDRWSKFENFLADMGECPNGMSLDREDNNGNYEPENCRWATPKQQGRNRRTNITITAFGKTQCAKAWAEELGIAYATLRYRLKKGDYSEAELLSTGRSYKIRNRGMTSLVSPADE